MKPTTKTLGQLLNEVQELKLVLPDFQRQFTWSPEQIRGLLVSIILQYPVGALLIGIDTTKATYKAKRPMFIDKKDFETRWQNMTENDQINLLLDGQQRLTSVGLLFSKYFTKTKQDLFNQVNIRKRWFLNLKLLGMNELELNIEKTNHTNYEDAKAHISMQKFYKTDSTKNTWTINGNAYSYDSTQSSMDLIKHFGRHGWLPIDEIFVLSRNTFTVNYNFILRFLTNERTSIIESSSLHKRYLESLGRSFDRTDPNDKRHWEDLEHKIDEWGNSLSQYFSDILTREIPVYEIESKDFDRVAGIFSVINISGTSLDNFDLLISRSAKSNWNLRSDIETYLTDKTYADQNLKNLTGLMTQDWKDELSLLTWFTDKNMRNRAGQLVKYKKGTDFPKFLKTELPKMLKFIKLLDESLGSDWHDKGDLTQKTHADVENFIKNIKLNPTVWDYTSSVYSELGRDDVQKNLSTALKLFSRAVFLLQYRLGIKSNKMLKYTVMFLPLAMSLTDKVWDELTTDPTSNCSQRLQRWFWHSIFGGAYQGTTKKNRALADIPRLLFYLTQGCSGAKFGDWVDCGEDSILRSVSPKDSRFDQIEKHSGAPGHGDKPSMTQGNSDADSTLKAMVLAFILREQPNDIKPNSKKGSVKKLVAYDNRLILDAEHLVSIMNYKNLTNEEIERDSPHPVNSPMNFTYLTKSSNSSFNTLSLYDKLDGSQVTSLADSSMQAHLLFHSQYSDAASFTQYLKSLSADKVLETILDIRYNNLMQRLKSLKPHAVSASQW